MSFIKRVINLWTTKKLKDKVIPYLEDYMYVLLKDRYFNEEK